MAGQRTRILGAVISDWSSAVLRHDSSIEIHHPLAGDGPGDSSHAMSGMAS